LGRTVGYCLLLVGGIGEKNQLQFEKMEKEIGEKIYNSFVWSKN